MDFTRDGCPDTYGWVADLKKVQAGNANEMRCPSNPSRGTEKLNDLVDKATGNAKEGASVEKTNTGFCTGFGTAPLGNGSTQRVALVKTKVAEGYNNNYASSWYMVRTTITGLADDGSGVLILSKDTAAFGTSFKGTAGTQGGIRQADLAGSDIPASSIPLLGDASLGDVGDRSLDYELADDLPVGSSLCEAFNDGPAKANIASAEKIQLVRVGEEVRTLVPTSGVYPRVGQTVVSGAAGDPNADGDIGVGAFTDLASGDFWLQDTRDWSALHNDTCNILMADGSVKSPLDLNGDTFLNPGFEATSYSTDEVERAADVGYTDGIVELNPFEVYSAPFLSAVQALKGRVRVSHGVFRVLCADLSALITQLFDGDLSHFARGWLRSSPGFCCFKALRDLPELVSPRTSFF